MKKILSEAELQKNRKLARKVLLFFVLPIALWIIIYNSLPDSDNSKTPITAKKINKDSLFARIKKDSLWKVYNVSLGTDSILKLTIQKDEMSKWAPEYFDTTYKLLESGFVQEISIYSKKNEFITTYGLKSAKIVDGLKSHKEMAYVISKDYVKNKLSFPEEADFDSAPMHSEVYADSTFKEIGNVVAKNAFGVKIKYRFTCYLKYLGGKDSNDASWSLEKVDMEQ